MILIGFVFARTVNRGNHFCLSSTVTDKFTESMYVLANEPSVALYRLQEHVRRSLPELVQHKVIYIPQCVRKGDASGGKTFGI